MKSLIYLLLLSFLYTTVQCKIVIEGKIINIKLHKEDCFYNEPIDGYGNMLHNPKKLIFLNDSIFKIETSIQKAGYIYLSIPEKRLSLYVAPNDSIFLTINYQKDEGIKKSILKSINVQGSNAAGHEIFAPNIIFFNCQDLLKESSFAKKSEDVTDFFQLVKFDLKRLISPFDSLHIINKIDDSYYAAIVADIKSTFAFHVINLFEFFYKTKNSTKSNDNRRIIEMNESLFTEKNSVLLRQKFYSYINPADTNSLHSILGKGYYTKFYQDVYAGITSSGVQFDSIFNNIDSSHQYLGYMRGGFLEAAWASIIYWEVAMKSDDNNMLYNYDLFKSFFPKSGFLVHLKERLKLYMNDSYLLKDSIHNFITFFETKKHSSLIQLVNQKFKGSYVFIDLWASWCSPCIQELIYKNNLKSMLDKRKIKLLYVSIDDQSGIERCKNIIDSKKVYGYHIIASKEMLVDIEKLVFKNEATTIPKYLLISPKGVLVDSNLPRPSDFKTLEKRIDNLISK